ncbi:MAG: hypothetical protein KC503_00605 [Myxococcales bacterium]|nr:hypothetical protein [Myxococcales bacterium]
MIHRWLALLLALLAAPSLARADKPLVPTPAPAAPAAPAASDPASRPAPATAKRSPENSKLVRMRDLLRRAIDNYHRSDFEGAKRLLLELKGYVATDRSREAQEVYTYLAYVHVAFGNHEAAVESLQRALAIRPDLDLSKQPPKIAAVFRTARQRFRAKQRALDHDPPRLRHRPVAKVKYGGGLVIEVETDDVSPIKRVVLHHRVKGDRGFSSVTMERKKRLGAGRALWVASIPLLAVVRPGLQYYIEAWDALGNGPGLKGSTARPIAVDVKGGPLRQGGGDDTAKPFYRRWWFWAIVASAVATAGGIGVGVYLAREERASGNGFLNQ